MEHSAAYSYGLAQSEKRITMRTFSLAFKQFIDIEI